MFARAQAVVISSQARTVLRVLLCSLFVEISCIMFSLHFSYLLVCRLDAGGRV